LNETYYTDARKAGVVFLRYEENRKPEAAADEEGKLTVRCFDELLQTDVVLPADLLVLSVGIDAADGNERLSKVLKVPLNEDRFFLEAHVKLRPVDFATEGIFLCGLAHGPKTVEESVTGALAAAGRSLTYLRKESLTSEATTAVIDPVSCSACGRCISVCPFSAIEMDDEKETAVVNQLLCKGCGGCATSCFSGAIDIEGFSNKQIMKEFESLFI
jgi:heterodisulfide reductase subunit A-like polyferredoxin